MMASPALLFKHLTQLTESAKKWATNLAQKNLFLHRYNLFYHQNNFFSPKVKKTFVGMIQLCVYGAILCKFCILRCLYILMKTAPLQY